MVLKLSFDICKTMQIENLLYLRIGYYSYYYQQILIYSSGGNIFLKSINGFATVLFSSNSKDVGFDIFDASLC